MITIKVGTDGPPTRDYSDPQTAFTMGVPSTLSDDYTLELYNDGEFVETAIAGNLVMDSVTPGSHRITVTAAATHSFQDHAGRATNPLKYDVAVGVGLRSTDHRSACVDIHIPNVTISRLQLSAGKYGIRAYPESGCIYEDLIIECYNNVIGIEGVNNTSVARRVIHIITGGGGDGFQCSNGGTIVNCTTVRCSNLSTSGTGFVQRYGTGLIKNCAAFGFTNFGDGNQNSGSSNNASDTTISVGTGNQPSLTYVNQFEVTTATGRDFRTKAGANLINTGVDDATNTPHDIIGTLCPQGSTTDIGCWEFVSPGTTDTLTGGGLALTGQVVGEAVNDPVAKADLAFTGQAITELISTADPVTKADLVFTGQAIGENYIDSVTKGTLTFTGQAVNETGNITDVVGASALTFAVQAISERVADPITKADLVFTGQDLSDNVSTIDLVIAWSLAFTGYGIIETLGGSPFIPIPRPADPWNATDDTDTTWTPIDQGTRPWQIQ